MSVSSPRPLWGWRCSSPAPDPRHACRRLGIRWRLTGVGRAITTYTIPIEGRDEWLAAARRLA
jgi:hypothetical protein